MDIAMIITDSMVSAASALYLRKSFTFIKAAKGNADRHKSNLVMQDHFTDHLYACLVGLFGGIIGFSFSIIHFIAQNILSRPVSILAQIEYGQDTGVVLILFSGIMFMHHMTHEETEGHPFYIHEYGHMSDSSSVDKEGV